PVSMRSPPPTLTDTDSEPSGRLMRSSGLSAGASGAGSGAGSSPAVSCEPVSAGAGVGVAGAGSVVVLPPVAGSPTSALTVGCEVDSPWVEAGGRADGLAEVDDEFDDELVPVSVVASAVPGIF